MDEKTLDIALTPVQSSQIHAIGYDAASSTLRVQFKSAAGAGSIYDYTMVPAETAEAFRKADSVGRFFGAKVKGRFEFKKLPKPEKTSA
jgi:hypothetical protein